MPIFSYRAVNSLGHSVQGVLDADSLEMAKEKLAEQDCLLVDIVERSSKIKLSLTEKLIFTRDLYQLLRSGMPLYEALQAIEEKTKGSRSHPFFLALVDQVRLGKLLSQALKKSAFDHAYLSMIQAGEESGSLIFVLKELSELLEREISLRRELFSAITYPLFLFAFSLGVFLFLLVFFVPAMEELFIGAKLPTLTKSIIACSHLVRFYPLPLLALFLTLFLCFFFFRRSEMAKKEWDVFFLRLPIVGNWMMAFILARWTRSLGSLLGAKVPLLHSLDLCKEIVNHSLFTDLIDQAKRSLEEGKSLSFHLGRSKWVPPLLTRMLSTGEVSGQLPEMLIAIAKLYEERLHQETKQYVQFVQPVLLLFLGALVALVLLATMLPLTDMSLFLDK